MFALGFAGRFTCGYFLAASRFARFVAKFPAMLLNAACWLAASRLFAGRFASFHRAAGLGCTSFGRAASICRFASARRFAATVAVEQILDSAEQVTDRCDAAAGLATAFFTRRFAAGRLLAASWFWAASLCWFTAGSLGTGIAIAAATAIVQPYYAIQKF